MILPRPTVSAVRRIIVSAALLTAGAVAAVAADAEPIPVDLELVLAVDVSQSMDPDEHQLQRLGYAEAFRHQDVVDAILFGPRGRIAVTYMEWGDAYDQLQVAPWMLIESAEDAAAFADILETTHISRSQRTSISRALLRAAAMMDSNEYDGFKRVIDVSGDGPNNTGPAVEDARDAVAARGVTINGLPIMLKEEDSWYDIPNLDSYYEDCVIAGPGSFVAPVDSLDELGATIRGKLILEIVGLPAEVHRAQAEEGPRRSNCLIGEQLWESRGGRFFR